VSSDQPARVLISAHRGGAERARPESLAAYQAAASTGAEYAEFDVRRAGDGELLVQHDDQRPDGEPPLTAAVVMRALAAGGVRGHVDLKGTGFEHEAVALAQETFGPDRFVVTTPDPASVAAIRAAFPAVSVGLSVGFGWASVVRSARRLRRPASFPFEAVRASAADWVAMSYRYARPDVLSRCVADGRRVMVWTVNDDRRLDRFLTDPRVSILVTDRPEYAVRRRQALTGR
jgi:glycerophosphoryl diester phosphodiesterase